MSAIRSLQRAVKYNNMKDDVKRRRKEIKRIKKEDPEGYAKANAEAKAMYNLLLKSLEKGEQNDAE